MPRMIFVCSASPPVPFFVFAASALIAVGEMIIATIGDPACGQTGHAFKLPNPFYGIL